MGTDHEHRVATYAEAEEAIRAHETIYLNDCFCRGPARKGEAAWEYCGHPVETCMGFHPPSPDGEGPAYEYREIPQAEALALFRDWTAGGLPFRFMEGETWICFCCACGCGWFRDAEGNRVRDPCPKSAFEERTDPEVCNLCGVCVDVCAWEARKLAEEALVVDPDLCSGCSACEHHCPEGAIEMVPRGTGPGAAGEGGRET